ncbi:hypothetical protein K501DRAFT_324809 [Backusella circina FSU 941]|nr:hypothetical protein K501DRAFT_324809 [Backusella circina FSU 941]
MSGDNYIGSKISLISLSDIRYVGVLHSINPLDSTVGLKQVRSFGTEGRRGKPEEEILPSDNVFDYVVFRGSDIKDLQVFEAPPKPATPQPSLPQDPAIMSMSSYPPMNPYAGSGNNSYNMPQPPLQQPAAPAPPPQQQPIHQQVPPMATKQQSPLQSTQNYWQPSPYSPTNANNDVQQQQLKQQQKKKQIEEQQAKLERDTLEELKAELEESNAMQPTINEAAIEQLAKKVSELNTGDDVIVNLKEEAQSQQQPQQQRINNRRYDNNNQRRNNNSNNNNNRYNNSNNNQYNNKPKNDFTIPTSEFDFEASNAKFNKDDIVKKNEEDQEEEEEITIPEADNFYNKTSSFFDNISCESKERNEQRQVSEPRRSHFQEERKLNMETFGQATVDQSRYRNNYRGRNRGGRGGYYRNNNNRNNYNNNNNNSSNGFRQNKDQQQEAN